MITQCLKVLLGILVKIGRKFEMKIFSFYRLQLASCHSTCKTTWKTELILILVCHTFLASGSTNDELSIGPGEVEVPG